MLGNRPCKAAIRQFLRARGALGNDCEFAVGDMAIVA